MRQLIRVRVPGRPPHSRWIRAATPAFTLIGVSESKELDPATQFRQLYDQEYLPVYRSIRAVVLDSAAAEDLVTGQGAGRWMTSGDEAGTQ